MMGVAGLDGEKELTWFSLSWSESCLVTCLSLCWLALIAVATFKMETWNRLSLFTVTDFMSLHLQQLHVNGAPWSAAYQLNGQWTGAISWRAVLRPSRKTYQFRLDPTQSCAPGGRCNRMSSVYHHALGNSPVSPDMRPTPLALTHMHNINHLHPCTKPYPWPTTHMHHLWLSNISEHFSDHRHRAPRTTITSGLVTWPAVRLSDRVTIRCLWWLSTGQLATGRDA